MAGSVRFVRLALVGLIVLCVTTGCGTLAADMHLTFRDDGVGTEMTMKGTGALGSALITSQMKDDFISRGWRASLDRQGEVVTLKASADSLDVTKRARLASGDVAAAGASDGFFDALTYERRGDFFVDTYTVRLEVPASSSPPPSGNQLIDDKTLVQIVNSMLQFKLSITLPGEIVETNADSKTGDTATWLLDYNSLTKGRELFVTTRRTNLGNVAVAAFGVVLAIGLVLVLVLTARRHSTGRDSTVDPVFRFHRH